jgi:5-methylcytosine-specific restriction endonuclease McrA
VATGTWRFGKTSTQRGYDYRWQKERKAFLTQHPFCVECLKDACVSATTKAAIVIECSTRGIATPWANVVDHIEPHRGDQSLFWDQRNWQSLCTTHHSRDKQRIENATE